MSTNNITRMLDSRNISYKVFEIPRMKLGARETARILQVSPEVIYKSIVIERREGGKPILAVVPGNREVDLKALAKALGEKKVSAATQQKAEQITQLQVGGISPLALINRGFDIVLDSSAEGQSEIHVSGGELGLNIRLPVKDLARITGAKIAPISRVSS